MTTARLTTLLAMVGLVACSDRAGSTTDGGPDDGGFQPEPDLGEPDGGTSCRNLARLPGRAVVEDHVTQALFGQFNAAPYLQQAIQSGQLLVVWELLGLEDPTATEDDASVDLAAEAAVDVDGDASDNFSGNEPLCLNPETLTQEDAPAIVVASSLIGGTLRGSTDALALPSFQIAFIPFPSVTVHYFSIEADVTANVGAFENGHMEGVLWATELHDHDLFGYNLLQVIACGISALGIPPSALNVDVDGDGMETITCGSNETIVSCGDFDGNGNPIEITGSSCGNQLADGFSFVSDFTAVSFAIGGVHTGN